MATTSSPQAGPDIRSSSPPLISLSIPILLLKTRSQPIDTYHEHFTTFCTTPKYTPIFVPVLQHAFSSSSLSSLRSLLPILSTCYSGLIFTSQRAVEAFASVVTSLANDDSSNLNDRLETVKLLKTLRLPLYTVGPATFRALESLRDAHFPSCSVLGRETGNGENLARYILQHHPRPPPSSPASHTLASNQILLPLLFLVGEQRRDIIPKILTSPTLSPTMRIPVSELIVYETQVMASFAAEFTATLLATSTAKTRWVIVFSPTGCEVMLKALGWLDEGTGKARKLKRRIDDVGSNGQGEKRGSDVFVACIGPTTREYLEREFGFHVDGKPRVRQPPQYQDNTEAFYQAQVVHYGLKPQSTKQAAKEELLRAFEASGVQVLQIPENIRKLEKELRERYRIANIAARKKYKEEVEHEQRKEEKALLKRKRQEEELMEMLMADRQPQKKAKKDCSSTSFDLSEVEGTYFIYAPDISDNYEGCDDPFILHLAISSTHSHIWGSFDFGIFEGNLRSRTPLSTSHGSVEFHWQGCDTGSWESTFGAENTARFTFSKGGKFVGEMYWDCFGTFKLVGKINKKGSQSEVLSKNVPEWKAAYRELDQEDSDRESVERWSGGHYCEEKARRTLNSDTDTGLDNESSEEEDEENESSEEEEEEESEEEDKDKDKDDKAWIHDFAF